MNAQVPVMEMPPMVYRITPEPSGVITAPGDITRQMQEASILEAEAKRAGMVRQSTAECSAVQCSAVLHINAWVRHGTAQHSTAQHIAALQSYAGLTGSDAGFESCRLDCAIVYRTLH